MYIPKKNRGPDELKDCECGFCGLKINRYNKWGYENKFINGHNSKGKNHPHFKGRVKEGEYWKIYKPEHPKASKQGYVKEHRLVYEEYYNCCLLDWVDVHHKNGKRDDNRIENLEAYSKIKHATLHATKYDGPRQCMLCPRKSTKCYIFESGFICHQCYMKKYRERKN